MLKLAGVDHYSNVTTQKGRHVEFVSVDFCKVFSESLILIVLLLFERFSVLRQGCCFSVESTTKQLETGSMLEEMVLKSILKVQI